MAYSTFSYNGIEFQEPFQVLDHKEVVILDSARNYLYTRHSFRIRANFNPSTTSYAAPMNGADAVATPGKPPAQTEANIRQQLQQSRGELLYQVNGDTIVESPAPGFSVDVNNGPVAVVHNIWERKGQKTFCVDFSVTTDINESQKFLMTGQKTPVVLSNLWRMTQVVGEDSLTTRLIQGSIVCRSDYLASLTAVPFDFLQQAMNFPVPLNFKRASVNVVVSEDGNSAEYVIVDAEQFQNITVLNGVIRIESSFRQTYSMTGMSEVAWMAAKLNADVAKTAIGQILSPGGSAYRKITELGGAAIDISFAKAELARNVAPRCIYVLTVETWGNKNITLPALATFTQQFIAARFTGIGNAFGQTFAGLSYSNWSNLQGRYCGASINFQTGPLQAVGNFVNLATGYGIGFFVPDPDAFVGQWVSSGNVGNPPLLGPNGISGNYLGAAIAAQLNPQNTAIQTPTQQGLKNDQFGGRQAKNLNISGQ